MPDRLSFGKHPFVITYNQPTDSPPLQSGANLLFEFVDAKGVVIFSEITTTLSGGGIGYVWIKKNPLRTSAEIADGAVDLVHLSATGTASNSTYLRGDNSWATVSAGAGGASGLDLNDDTKIRIGDSCKIIH